MTMPSSIITASTNWQGVVSASDQKYFGTELESGGVLYFPSLAFDLQESEMDLLDPRFANPKRRNISLSADGGELKGVFGDQTVHAQVRALIARYQKFSRQLIDGLIPQYAVRLRAAPTSLRLHEVEQRKRSWRADDSRLHVDAFPSRPNRGERILRVFANISMRNEPRIWRIGEPFEDAARRFLPRIPRQRPGSATLLRAFGITKSHRTEFDHLMLHLHDAMKADMQYQATCPQQTATFSPSSTWICFSDQTSHAVVSGQFMLEQTFFLPPNAMLDPTRSPLSTLQRLTGRTLI